jgi:hypothetical protein
MTEEEREDLRRRVKAYYLDSAFMRSYLTAILRGKEPQITVVPGQVPDDVSIVRLQYEFAQDALGVVLRSREFPPVPDNQCVDKMFLECRLKQEEPLDTPPEE